MVVAAGVCAPLISGWLYLVPLPLAVPYFAFVSRRGRYMDGVHAQVLARTEFPSELWGDPQRAARAKQVSDILADEFNWPNAHFIPDDPLKLLLWAPAPPGDGGEGLEFVYRLKKECNLEVTFPASVETMRFGDFLDRCLRERHRS
jgi:hypothetical protein